MCEEDVYAVSLSGGNPRRITDAPGPVRRPIISPDGTTVAFTVVEEECQEIYACSVRGGPLSQITFQGAEFARAAAWAPDGSALFFIYPGSGRGTNKTITNCLVLLLFCWAHIQ